MSVGMKSGSIYGTDCATSAPTQNVPMPTPIHVTINYGARVEAKWNELKQMFGEHDCKESISKELDDWCADGWQIHFLDNATFRIIRTDFAYIEFNIKENSYFVSSLCGGEEPEVTFESSVKINRLLDLIMWYNNSMNEQKGCTPCGCK